MEPALQLLTPKAKVQASCKEHRSVFLATLYPAGSTEEVKGLLAAHAGIFADATHNCYAYMLGAGQETQYYSDQGEPSGTAGKPILHVLLRHGLTNALLVVSRYFGGIKLGVRGLIDAYTQTAELVVAEAKAQDLLQPFRLLKAIKVSLEYPQLEQVNYLLRKHQAELSQPEFGAHVIALLSYPAEEQEGLPQYILDLTASGQLKIIK